MINTSEPMQKIVIKYLLIFQSCQMDCKEIKCPFQWCGKHEIMFLTIDLLTYQILNIVKTNWNHEDYYNEIPINIYGLKFDKELKPL
jgi:hypothetical protein